MTGPLLWEDNGEYYSTYTRVNSLGTTTLLYTKFVPPREDFIKMIVDAPEEFDESVSYSNAHSAILTFSNAERDNTW